MKSFFEMPHSEFSDVVASVNHEDATAAIHAAGLVAHKDVVDAVTAWANLQSCGVFPDNATKAAARIAQFGWNDSWAGLAALQRKMS
jgi:hypothetical protein